MNSENSGNMLSFYEDKGILKFSVMKENLLYPESVENYVNTRIQIFPGNSHTVDPVNSFHIRDIICQNEMLLLK